LTLLVKTRETSSTAISGGTVRLWQLG